MYVLHRQHEQSAGFCFLMVDLNAARKSKFFIPFGTSPHIFGTGNTSDSLTNVTVLTCLEKNVILFLVLYTEFLFNGKTFMRIGERSVKTLYNSVARDCKLLWCTET